MKSKCTPSIEKMGVLLGSHSMAGALRMKVRDMILALAEADLILKGCSKNLTNS